MPRACSTDLRMRVIAAMQAGATCRAVAASLDIAPSTAGKWNRAFSRSGSRQLRATARSYFSIDIDVANSPPQLRSILKNYVELNIMNA